MSLHRCAFNKMQDKLQPVPLPMSEPRSSSEHRCDREIVSACVFRAAPGEVFEAFADPVRLARWWGPAGFASTIHEFDLRPGGRWRFTMHGPDGARYEIENRFVTVERPGRIVFRHPQPGHEFLMTMEFAADSGRTRLTWRMLFDSAAECARVRDFIIPANEQNFDRLAIDLQAPPAASAFSPV